MKATGIVRRIDELGRIVIPKEIRRTQRIRRGDPLEIFTSAEGEVIFKKYSPMVEIASIADQYTVVLAKQLGLTAFVCDKDTIVAVSGSGKRELAEMRISRPLERIMEGRKTYIMHSGEEQLLPCEGCSRNILAVCPVITAGDVIGAIGFLAAEPSTEASEELVRAVELGGALLAKQLEE